MTSLEIREVRKSRQFYADVLTTAVEGGIGYWSRVSVYHWYHPGLTEGTAAPGEHESANAYATIHPVEDDEWDVKELTIPLIEKALNAIDADLDHKLMSARWRRHILGAWFSDDAGDIDASDADLIAQIAVFGEQVYS